MIEPEQHVMVVSALARLAEHGGWARLLDGKPVEAELDRVDVRLLAAAGVLRSTSGRTGEETWEPVELHPWYADPAALAGGMLARLRRALSHAEARDGADEAGADAELAVAVDQGRSSASAASVLAEDLLTLMPEAYRAFTSGGGRFLDVGVGTAAVSRRLCRIHPTATAVGLDVSGPVLEVARDEIAADGLGDRIEVRHQSVADLTDVEAYDLAWVPQVFLPRQDLLRGLVAVRRALRPGGWLVMPIAAAPARSTDFEQAVYAHDAELCGGGSWPVTEAARTLVGLGYAAVAAHDLGAQVIMLAQRPSLP